MINYPPDLEQFVAEQVATGMFRDREEFAVEAARLYQEMEARRAQLKADIQIAIDEADRGLVAPLDIEEIQAELIAELDENGRPK